MAAKASGIADAPLTWSITANCNQPILPNEKFYLSAQFYSLPADAVPGSTKPTTRRPVPTPAALARRQARTSTTSISITTAAS